MRLICKRFCLDIQDGGWLIESSDAQLAWKTPPPTTFVTPMQRPIISPIRRSNTPILMLFLFVLLIPAQHWHEALLRFFAFIILFCSFGLGHAFEVLWPLLLIGTSPVLLHPASVFACANPSMSVSNTEWGPVIFCFDSERSRNEYGEELASITDFS